MPVTSSLRTWLRRPPQPSSIRYRTEDDEERMLKLAPELKNRWRNAEEALLTAKATAVEALDEKGDVIRATRLEVGEDGEPLDPEEAEASRNEKNLSKQHKEMASLLNAYGQQLNNAFSAGAKSANTSHDKLVELVDILTSQLGNMITNVSMLSQKLGKALQAVEVSNEDEDEAVKKKNDEMVGNIVQLAIAKFMQGGMQMPKPNGKTNGAPSAGKDK